MEREGKEGERGEHREEEEGDRKRWMKKDDKIVVNMKGIRTFIRNLYAN